MSNHGLRGHETVIRLVGKRRKLALSAKSPAKTSTSLDIKHEVGSTSIAASNGNSTELDIKTQNTTLESITSLEEVITLQNGVREASGSAPYEYSANISRNGVLCEEKVGHINWVKCPICEKSIRGDVINTHLDVCLQGGVKDKKRKSKQLTMSQFRGTCVSRPVDKNISAGFHRRTTHEEQGGFGSLKVETCVTFGLGGGGNWIDEKAMETKSTKLEESRTGSLSPVLDNPYSEGIRQTRMRMKRLLIDDSQKRSDLHPLKEESRHEVNHKGSSVCLGRNSEESPLETSCQGQMPGLDTQDCDKNRMLDLLSEESSSPHGLSEGSCRCHCHLSTSNGGNEEDGSGDVVTVESHIRGSEESDGNRGLIEVKKIGPGSSIAVEPLDPRYARSTSMTPENDIVVGVLDTKIVGRRFHRGTVCKEGMKVAILREPENPKDPNAIKVIEFESPGGLALGHLPREISLHLASLLDKCLLRVWGSVTSVPAPIFGAVKVKLFCESTSSSKEDFLKVEGAGESLQNLLDAAENFTSLQLPPSESVSKYQQNFLYILQTVLERDSHLFKDKEKTFLEKFNSLSDDAQRLFIRLYQRKGPWFRVSTVEYKDVADVGSASEELVATGYMDTHDSPDEDFESALRKRFEVLNVLELRQFVCSTFIKKKSEAAATKKEDLVSMAVSLGFQKHANLIPESSGQSALMLMQMLSEVAGKCIRVSDRADFLLWRLKRLFFLNGDTELSAFLVVDLGIVKYPRFKCWRERNIFDTHEALLAYEQALEVAQRMDMALECNDSMIALQLLERARYQMRIDDSNLAPAAKTPTFLARFSASYIYRNVCTLGVSILERERRYVEAVDLLKQLLSTKFLKSGRWGYWTVRLSMDLDHLGRKEESLQVAEEGVNDPWIRGGDLVALQRRVVRLGKPPRRWKIPPYAAALKRNCKEVQIQGRPLNCVTGLKSWFYGYDGQQCRVEELALQYFASEEGGGWQGVHCEGGVWMTFFGLLMWDILFSDVPDVFQTPFQTAPLDLDTEVFFLARQSLIEAKLSAIAEGDIANLLASTWNRHKGTMCRGVNWERHSLEELQTIALCVGGPGLSTVCRLLAEDHAGWTAGMPDLLLWRTRDMSDIERISEIGTDHKCCLKCGCYQLERVLGSRSLETGNMHYSGNSKMRVEVGDCGLGTSFNVPKSSTKTLATSGKRKYGEAKLVEVKGPRDRLSEQQRAWIWILMNAGLTVEVCKVLEEPVD